MALAEEHLFSRLSGFAGITALISSRIYPIKIPPNTTMPALTYTRISGRRIESLLGNSALCYARYQLDAWGRKYSDVKALAEQVRLCLEGYKGTLAGVIFYGVNYLGDQDLYEDDTEVFRVSMDFVVHHNEEQPA